ncbi:uncharacterized protein [Halyomorpha halys]|uniref:uncharacterized protein n=1 Tax=Halyomorpha halys TaxID=286706 RepID=UPI0006D4CB9A|nr:uncharacterized protein LOC106691089 [Halyomorpha halys]
METNILWSFLIVYILTERGDCQCSKQDYQRCVKLADPLLKDPHLIYPDNPRDIERVCRTWTYFVECVKTYTDRCFTESRRKEFNKAVESPVSSIHKLCSSPDYRNEYMKHASCMKMMLIEDNHCGRHYKLLVNQVSGEAAQSSVCCSHHIFRECVVDQTRNTCDAEATPFSSQMLDKALSFLRDQCSNYIPNQDDCPGLDFYKSTTTMGRSDEGEVTKMRTPAQTQITQVTQMTPSPETARTTQTQAQPQMQTTQTRITNPWTPVAETKATTTGNTVSAKSEWTSSSVAWTPSLSTDTDTSRTSFARGITWTSSEATPIWKVSGSYQNAWLPSSRPMDNAIDEPNQQGLGSGFDGGNGSSLISLSISLLIISLLQQIIIR